MAALRKSWVRWSIARLDDQSCTCHHDPSEKCGHAKKEEEGADAAASAPSLGSCRTPARLSNDG